MRPGALLVRLTVPLAVLGLMVPFVPAAAFLLLGATLLLLALTVAEGLVLRRVTVTVAGAENQAVFLGSSESVSLSVHSDARRSLRLVLRQAWPELLEEASSLREGVLRPGEVLRFSFDVRGVARGRAKLEPPVLGITALGLAERVVRAGEPSEITVIPDLRAVGRLHSQLNAFALRGMGARLSARLGKGREFDRLREYVSGDDVRDMAWKASARHEKLIVREYRLDRSQDVLLCLDSGHRMATRAAGLTRLDHAVNGAVLLAYVCNRTEDRVGMLAFASTVTVGPRPGRGRAQLRRLTDFAAGVGADLVHSDYLGLASELRRGLRHRSLVVLFTALSEMDKEPILRAVKALSPPHLVLVMVLRDPVLEAAAMMRPANKRELARVLVARDLSSVREQTIRELRRLGALVVESTPSDVGVLAMNAYIDIKRRQLL